MDRKCITRLTTLLLIISAWWSVTAQEVALPSAPNSVKFAAIGDAGAGNPEQYDIANQMTRFHAKFPFDRVIMLGDNIYGGQGPSDLVKKLSQPYKALLDIGVKFYASLGNHDDPVNNRKTVFHLVGLDSSGNVIVRKRCSRIQLLKYTANLRVQRIGMEACSGSHFLARALREQGHDARLIPAQYVKPYVKTNKSDYIDAEAIAEAVQRPTTRFVPIKTEEQLDLQTVHREASARRRCDKIRFHRI